MKAIKALGFVLGLPLVFAGCAAGPQSYVPQVNYAYNADDGRMYLRWNCVFEPPFMVMQGTVNNVLMTPMKNSQISVYGVNAQGAQVSSAVDNSLPFMLETMDRTPFEIKVKTAGTEVAFNMWYSYQVGGAFMMGDPQRNLKNNACPGVPR